MLRFAPGMIRVFVTATALLGATALAGCASTSIASLTGGKTAAEAQKQAAATPDKSTPTDLEGGIRQAQLLRQAGHYDDAIKILSQLMLVASDDPRVVAEYGKSLAQQGRAQEAVEFLNRAIELSSNDWTLYSALGVSYDQLGNQVSARAAYEHALVLRPNEPSVLNNYALSRMLANDPDGAHFLIAKAQANGGATDSKIAANIALLDKLAPPHEAAAAAPKPAIAAAVLPAPATSASGLPGPSLAKPAMVITKAAPHPAPPAVPNAPRATAPVAQSAPRPVAPPQAVAQQSRPAPVVASGVVMQPVPFDPYAGPVTPKKPQAKAVAAKDTKLAPPVIVIEQPAPKTADSAKPDAKTKAAPVKTADKNGVPSLRLTADARNP